MNEREQNLLLDGRDRLYGYTVLGLFTAGFLVRAALAHTTFLNPDEALHYALAAQPTLADAYKASLTTVHPPLYILFLHCWRWLGTSELALRLPSALAAVGFCFLMYRWLKMAQYEAAARVSFVLFLFLPAFVMLSAEVRQYSLLLLFASANLYFLDYAIECDSWWLMLASAFALWLAILTHYSAYIFAFVLGIYAADRLFRSRSRFTTIAVWVLAQVAAVLLCGALYASHISKLRTQGVSQMIADTWLRMSIFHRGQDHFLNFAFTRTVRLFRFLFTQGTVGFIGVLLFAGALIWLARGTTPSYSLKPTPRQIALLLFLPFCVTLLASLAGVYPYGGTRHDVLLGMFAIPGLSIGITRLIPMKWLRYSAVISGLLVCNLFPSPVPPYIPLRDQQKGNMTAAVQFVTQSAPPGSLIFADHPAGLLLSYYLCGRTVVPFEPQAQPFLRSDCAGYQLITPVQQPWVFQANTFAGQITQIRRIYEAPADSKIVIFQTGWFDSKDPRWLSALARSGCKSPHYFGANVLICEIATGTADA